MADLFNEKRMLETLATGEDLHAFAAKNMFGENYTSEGRTKAKSLNYGIPYGMSDRKLATDFNISEKEAKSTIDSWFNVFPSFKSTFPVIQKQVVNDGYVRVNDTSNRICFNTNYDKYLFVNREIKRLKRLKTRSWEDKIIPKKYWSIYFSLKSSYERKAINSKIQGTAADIGKLAGVYMLNWIRKNNYQNRVKITLFVHDEYIFECKDELTQEVFIAAQDCMERAASVFCKQIQIPAEPEIARHWVH
jgi:DNA polymerase I